MRKLVSALTLAALAAVALLTAPAAFAGPSVAETVHVQWTPPTTNLDGTALTSALTYNVYGAPSASGTWSKVDAGVSASPVSFTAPAGDTCFAVTAVEQVSGNPVEGNPSAPACLVLPGTPSGVTVTVTVTIS